MGRHARKHVYRVGELRVPAASSELVRGPRSRSARKVKDLLRRRAEAPVGRHQDPTEFEPPIRKPLVSRERSSPRFFSPSSNGASHGREMIDYDVEDPGDD